MQITEKINTSVQKLPALFQTEVLDFVEYLLVKAERTAAQRAAVQQAVAQQDEPDWSVFSLNSAMRGMEDEETPTYSIADLKVVFS